MQENAAVNWKELLNDYNSVMHTDFKTPQAMLKHVYAEKKTFKKTGKVFLLSCPTIDKYMKLWNIPCLPAGHRYPGPCLKALLKLGDVSILSCTQIAKKVGYSVARVGTLMKENGIKYKRLRKWVKH